MDNFELQPAADLQQAELDGVKMAYSNEILGRMRGFAVRGSTATIQKKGGRF